MPRSARADDNYSLGLGTGRPLMINDFPQIAAPGFAVGGEYIHQFSWVFGLGLQADYLPFKKKTINAESAKIQTSVKVASLAAVLRVSPFYDYQLGPYFLGGAGVNNYSLVATGTPNPGFAWTDTGTAEKRTVLKASSTGFTYLLGLGMEGVISKSGVTAGVEARWHFFSISQEKFGANTVGAFTVLARIGVRLPG